MEELQDLRFYVETKDYANALLLINEMEEMSKEDKIHKMGSFIEILLIHLIKQQAEQRTTRSWDISIQNAIDNIRDVNKRRKSGGYYLVSDELKELIQERYRRALRRASLEAFEGNLDELELSQEISEPEIQQKALSLILDEMF